jgi:23S rRNA (adenine2030-N6)-methyltransferase
MNYRHIYHAGNFADIIKHLILITTIIELKQKPKPFAIIDSFAGPGIYNLMSNESNKTLESNFGIRSLINNVKLLENQNSVPELINIFLNLIAYNSEIYYGSPKLASMLLRDNDRLILSELHNEEFNSLKESFRYSENKLINIHNMDAYNAIKAFIPFKENRGLIFIDPPFEVTNEFDKIIDIMKIIKKRAMNICSIIWYPIKNEKLVDNFYKQYKSLNFNESLIIEYDILNYSLSSYDNKGLKKSGIIITNPPMIKAKLIEVFTYLKKIMNYNFNIN